MCVSARRRKTGAPGKACPVYVVPNTVGGGSAEF